VEGVERRDERRHRVRRVDAQLGEPLGQPRMVADLGGGHAGERGAAGERRGEARVLGQPVERGQLRIGQHAEQVDDGAAVDHAHGQLLGVGRGPEICPGRV
jgi:hypothetical protein